MTVTDSIVSLMMHYWGPKKYSLILCVFFILMIWRWRYLFIDDDIDTIYSFIIDIVLSVVLCVVLLFWPMIFIVIHCVVGYWYWLCYSYCILSVFYSVFYSVYYCIIIIISIIILVLLLLKYSIDIIDYSDILCVMCVSLLFYCIDIDIVGIHSMINLVFKYYWQWKLLFCYCWLTEVFDSRLLCDVCFIDIVSSSVLTVLLSILCVCIVLTHYYEKIVCLSNSWHYCFIM